VAWEREQIHQLFDTLQFRVLRDRLYTTLPNGITGSTAATTPAPAEAGQGFEVEVTRLGPGEVAAWLSEHAGDGRTGIAASGTWGRGTGALDGVALAVSDGSAAFIDPVQLAEHDEQAFAAWLADPAAAKAMHDAKGPMHAMAARGLQLAGLTSDTALAAYLALPGQRSFDLADLALRYLNRQLPGGATPTGQLTLEMDGEVEAAVSLAQRAVATAELADALDADLEQRGATALLANVELPLVSVLAEMERAGIAADTDHLADMSARLGGEVKAAEQAAYAITGHEFNLGSPKQLQEVLFTELGLPKT
jgi:DNA polymerase-1